MRTEKVFDIKYMNKQSALLLAALAIAIVGLTSYVNMEGNNLQLNKVPQTVPYVDINSFAGAWHEQAVIPYFWERGCTQTTAHYSLNKDGTIKVNNTCVINGKPK
jgi:apolipoprotein D and lipocalin family protein